MNYLFSILDHNTNLVHFYSYIESELKLEISTAQVGVNFYSAFLERLAKRIDADKSILEKQTFLVGFGQHECATVSARHKKLQLIYEVNKVHDECFEPLKSKLSLIHGKVQYVSLKIQRSDTYIQYLLKPFLKEFKLSKSISKEADECIEGFKASFLRGLDHLSYISLEETQIIFSLPDSTNETLLKKAGHYPTQNGIISMELGNNIVSDFIYSLTNFTEYSMLCCFRHQGEEFGIAIAKIGKDGKVDLLSPSGINDTSNTLKLIGLLNPMESGIDLFKKNISTSFPLGDIKDKNEVITIHATQVIVPK